MATYTVEIQANDASGEIWQALAPAENITEDMTAEEVAKVTAEGQNITEGSGWRVRVWEGADADTGVEPAAEWLAPEGGTPIEELAATIRNAYGIPLRAAEAAVWVHVDQIADDPDLWDADAATLSTAGVEVISAAIAESYRQGRYSTAEQDMLDELGRAVTVINEQTERRDELICSLMHTGVPRSQITAAAGVKEARLYQIRDGRR